MVKHLNAEQTMLYTQSEGGGGVALGLLLGPLGAAANVKMIDTQTETDAARIKGKLVLDPEAAMRAVAPGRGFAFGTSAGPADVKFSPYVVVSKSNETDLRVSSSILIESPEGAEKWVRRYRYQLPGTYTLDDLEKNGAARSAALQAELVKGYAALLRHLTEETEAGIAKERPITVKSAFLTPRIPLELYASLVREEQDRIWVRTTWGVIAMASVDAEIKQR
jgi:hypothetical protein